MGDAHPSLAPQWLKAGTSSNLRPQTQGGLKTGNGDDSSRGPSWRESGSRLGLGAGADRDIPADKIQTPMTSTRKERGAFPDRSSSRVYQPSTTERRSNFQRPVYPAPHRQLSDRELLEQIPALRPGLKLNSSALVDDSYKPSTGSKEADRGLRGGSQANLRKPAGSPRQSPLLLPKGEKEIAHAAPAKSSAGGQLSPRHSATDQPWTSRLTDAAVPELQADTQPALPVPAVTLAPTEVEPASKPVPRMADTILQAQSTAAQEVGVARATKARKEHLALRQSKQLVPVMSSSKARHPGGNPAADRPLLTNLKKSSGLEPLGKLAASPNPLRREEEGGASVKSLPHISSTGKSGMVDGAVSTPSPRALAYAGRPARERDRLTFFSSLRRKASEGDPHNAEESEHLPCQGGSTILGISPDTICERASISNNAASPSVKSAPSTDCTAEAAFDRKDEDDLEMTAEELAFMRSLGWEDAGDDASGGLTEEEVAAFKAQCPPRKRSMPTATTKAKGAHSHSNISATTTENVENNRQQLSCSFHSELEFSDSDSP